MKRLLPILLVCISVFPAFSQMTITSSDYLALVGEEKTRTNNTSNDQATINSLIAKSGSGQTWDMSNVVFTPAGTTTAIILAGTSGTPGATDPAFANASHVVKQSSSATPNQTAYAYLTINSESATMPGSLNDSAGTHTKQYFTPAYKALQFPLSMGVKWTSQTVLTSPQYPGFSVAQSHSFEVDGEGTLIFPGNKQKAVLRLRDTSISDYGGFADTSVIYSFVNKTDRDAASIVAPKVVFGQTISGTLSYYSGGNTGVSENENDMFSVLSNSPNPFSVETDIYYSLKRDATVKIVVNDALGREISTIVNERQSAGKQSINFNANNLPAGQYYYTIVADGMSITKPMSVVK